MAPTGGTETVMVHGTAIAAGGEAVLLRGPSGCGKSDLALRVLGLTDRCFAGSSFALVADDQVVVRRSGGELSVMPPPALEGLIEVRGLGILPVAHLARATLTLIVELSDRQNLDRLPDPWPFESLLGISLPLLRIAAFEASAPLKLALALSQKPWQRSSP